MEHELSNSYKILHWIREMWNFEKVRVTMYLKNSFVFICSFIWFYNCTTLPKLWYIWVKIVNDWKLLAFFRDELNFDSKFIGWKSWPGNGSYSLKHLLVFTCWLYVNTVRRRNGICMGSILKGSVNLNEFFSSNFVCYVFLTLAYKVLRKRFLSKIGRKMKVA